MVSVDELKNILKTEYGITDMNGLEKAIEKQKSIDISIMTFSDKGRTKKEKHK